MDNIDVDNTRAKADMVGQYLTGLRLSREEFVTFFTQAAISYRQLYDQELRLQARILYKGEPATFTITTDLTMGE